MGYVLPIQNYQATNYANRMTMGNYDFAYINAVQGIKMKSLFEEELEDQARDVEEDETNSKSLSSRAVPYKGFIQPNPATLSPEIAKISGKGMQFNTYA
ncbi:hypothetical protein [Paenisporosarcina cavernae]|uniref:Uncharacterized protein n=1 Tax=Paenisporosarcina cavernae TaxID=2320858 RepID=A0A385YTP0_9BACL|nr:hypothetical protein [Paenisporosarcina cavernae]AYC29038.1 hypothetical protein D3873_03795 [Paenisporosarcina cavernae]